MNLVADQQPNNRNAETVEAEYKSQCSGKCVLRDQRKRNPGLFQAKRQ